MYVGRWGEGIKRFIPSIIITMIFMASPNLLGKLFSIPVIGIVMNIRDLLSVMNGTFRDVVDQPLR